ncbi:hypothetical protein [Bacillus cereus]|uniref:hypothetical protein n=1 Tax=Bacillus cereus TaxID=1396 RepID=UPI000BFB81BB|nr:hypothetical protein [Bacillus cereus]PGR83747.1 hypothetical protein COC63_07085 [Bacillus cereus]
MIGDVYMGFSQAVKQLFPTLIEDLHGDIEKGRTYQVEIQKPKLVAGSRVYGMCTFRIKEFGVELASVKNVPFGLVVQEEEKLYRDVQSVLQTAKESTVMEQELQGLWVKVLEDRIKMLEKEETPLYVSMGYTPPKDVDTVKTEFRNIAMQAFSKFYLVLMGKLGGTKGKFLICVDDVRLAYQGVYRMNIAVQVKPADSEKMASVVFALPVEYDYFDKKMMPTLDRVTKDLMMQFTASQKAPFEFDGVWMRVMGYNGIDKTLRWLMSDNTKETKVMLNRVKTVLQSEEVKKCVKGVRGFQNEIVKVELKPLQGAKTKAPLYLGANGIASGEVGVKVYDRQDTETNLTGALQTLVSLYGASDVWFQLLNCYDLRKRVD